MRHLHRMVLTVALGVVVALCSAPIASAQDLHKHGGRLVAPTKRIDGVTGPEVQAEGWYRVYALPLAENPFAGNGEGCVRLGRHGKVLLAYGFGPACTVKQGTAVWINGYTAACSNVEEPPFFGADEAAQRECGFRFFQEVEPLAAILATVDGGRAVDIHNRRYEFYTPQRAGQMPEDNVFGLPPQPFTFTAYGWGAWLKGLPLGQHVLRSEAIGVDGRVVHVWEAVVNVVC